MDYGAELLRFEFFMLSSKNILKVIGVRTFADVNISSEKKRQKEQMSLSNMKWNKDPVIVVHKTLESVKYAFHTF